jgi:hypothetical protein
VLVPEVQAAAVVAEVHRADPADGGGSAVTDIAPIDVQCSAECGNIVRFMPGQEWRRCGECDTLNFWPGGATDD